VQHKYCSAAIVKEGVLKMTIATHRSQPWAQGIVSYLNVHLQHMRAATQQAYKRRTIYRSTLSELCGLTDRELADIGIPRSHVRRVAREAAKMVQSDE
jgi:uncharacterized protein YjiS (DUF1127 family)